MYQTGKIAAFSFFILCLFIGYASSPSGRTFPPLNEPQDSLSSYQNPNFYLMDSGYHSIYPFVDFEKNNYTFYSERSPNFEHLYFQLDSMIKLKDRKLNFYHIGGSHIQADIYSNDARMFLQTYYPGVPGERGMVFPFDLAGTNNPGNYEFKSPNKWTAYRSVFHKDPEIDYGLLGAVIMCDDSVIQMNYHHDRTEVRPGFSKVRIYHNKGDLPYELNFGDEEILITDKKQNLELGFTEVTFTDKVDSLDVQFARTTEEPLLLEIYGLLFMNDDPGIAYTSIGINGAGLYTYLDCQRYAEQLKSFPPDFFAFSVGTNDGNVPYSQFDPQVYKNNLEKLMKIALKANPNCALLLTVPNDSYYRRKYLNKNIAREREVIIELAEEYQMAVWDMYGIMGELGSSRTWQRNGLMRSDLVHFTTTGYHFKGELYIDAFLKYMEQMDLQFNTTSQN